MAATLAIFSAVIIALSAYGVVAPRRLTALMRRFMEGPGAWGAAALRLFLAALLWLSAPVSRTPVAFKVLAVITLLAAIALPVIGTPRLLRLIDRLDTWPRPLIRLQCSLGVALGAFLLWSVFPALGAG